jgi:hypothetical protein
MISGLPRSGQPGKAVGHAVGKQTLRHDLMVVLQVAEEVTHVDGSRRAVRVF